MKAMKAKTKRTVLIVLAIVLALGAATLGALATFWTEYLWFDNLGFSGVYLTRLLTRVGTGVGFGLVALLVLLLHIMLIRRLSKPRSEWTISTPDGDINLKELAQKVSTSVVVTAAVLVATAMGVWASRHWEEVLRLIHRTPFGQREPILGYDIGYYIFQLPIQQFTQEWLVYLTGICVAFSAIVYFAREAIVIKGRTPEMSPGIRRHLLFALACVLAAVAWGYRIEMFETLFSKRGIAYGATYTDVYANLIFYRIMIWLCLAAALALIVFIFWRPKKGHRALLYPAYTIAAVVAVYLIGTYAWPTVIQRVVVDPNELEKERPYLAHAIAGTRAAYSLDKVETRPFPAEQTLTAEDLHQHKNTIDNIKIWDHHPLRAAYQQLQVIRLYYNFPNINVDRYRIGDRYWQVMLSARELVHRQLPPQSQTWVNEHIVYTHGYGVCLSPVTQARVQGLPDLWVKDLPPQASFPELEITQPGIYYGLETNNYVLTDTEEREFDYPAGDTNVFTVYDGNGGVNIGTLFRRALFAVRFADVNLVFTRYLTPESRILFNRHVQERVHAIAPFLMLDQEPYMVIADGRLRWIQDAYTISYRYPYSQPTPLARGKRINYLRNSVKVVVDAYDGTADFYVWDEADPMIQTYRKIFPRLFRGQDEMPESLRSHVRYPKDLFAVQAMMYESFHMTDPGVFYNQEDKWSIAKESVDKTLSRVTSSTAGHRVGITAAGLMEKSPMDPYFMIMRLPEEDEEEFLLMAPFTPSNKQNMVAWMAARCDGEHYGRLLVYTFPKARLIYGPEQIEARISQDDHISQWITLRNQHGSNVIRGELLVIPIEDSILYVQPIFLQSTQTRLPELKQVVVAFGDRLAMRETLGEALFAVFGGPAVTPGRAPGEGVASLDLGRRDAAAREAASPAGAERAPTSLALPQNAVALIRGAMTQYEEGQQRLAEGDWGGYGVAQQELKRILERLDQELAGQLAPQASE